MRKTLLSILGLLCFIVMQAQVAKTVNMTQAGTLSYVLTEDEKSTITDLTLAGPIDARDFKTMRDLMPVLAVLDMEGANIVAYSGNEGTYYNYDISYPINEIPKNAFSKMYNYGKNLESVTLPVNLTSIGSSAFAYCKVLTGELKLPTSLASIEESAFSDCCSLTGELKLPADLTSIGSYAFSGCNGLTGKLMLPANLTIISNGIFSGCSDLVGELILPSGVTSIGDHAFSNCSGLTGELKFPDGLTSIGSNAFSGCSGLVGELILPSGVTSIGDGAFNYCSGLSCIRSFAMIPPNIYTSTFSETNIKIAFVPKGSKNAYREADFWNDFIIIDEELSYTLHISTPGTLGVTLVNAGGRPNSVTSLELTGELNNDDFMLIRANMPLLHTINMEGSSNVSIPDKAFSSKATLRNIVFPDGLRSIGEQAFYNCSGLTSIKFPDGLNSIGSSAFSDCRALTGKLIFPAGLASIGSSAFYNCSGLTSVNLPAGLNSIGSSAFYRCSSLTSIEFADGLTSIGSFAFSDCRALTGKLIFPISLTSINSHAFSGCSGLSSIDFSDDLTSIETSAFLDCKGLTSIHIKKSVKSIGARAFSGCSDVSKITCESVIPPSLETDTFKDINNETCELHVPQGSQMNYLLAPHWGNFVNIIEIDKPSGIITPDKTIRTWKANGQLFVESTEEMSAAEVVDMSGRTACSISKTAYAYVLNLPSNGVYVVRIRTVNGEVKTVKVAM